MSSLFGILGLGANALLAETSESSVTANNVANVNTPGYSREVAVLGDVANVGGLIGGVVAASPTRIASNLVSNQLRNASGSLGASTALVTGTNQLQEAVTGGGATLDESISALFSSFNQVASSPTDPSLRQQAVTAAQTLATNFSTRAAAIAQTRSDANSDITANVAQVNSLTAQIASLNVEAVTSADPTILDKRDDAAQQLSALVGGSGRVDPNGNFSYTLPGGGTLVNGLVANKLVATVDPTTGFSDLTIQLGAGSQQEVTNEITGGTIGGDLQVRDVAGANAANQLDQLAFDTATQINAVHSANAGLDGTTGNNLFVEPTTVAGAAAAFAVDPTVEADPSKFAAAAPGAGTGDASGALALVNLGTQKVAGGGTATFADQAVNIGSSVGEVAQAAQAQNDSDTAVQTGVTQLQSSISGVDTNEELTKLSQFQNASTAMSQVFAQINTLLSDMITNL